MQKSGQVGRKLFVLGGIAAEHGLCGANSVGDNAWRRHQADTGAGRRRLPVFPLRYLWQRRRDPQSAGAAGHTGHCGLIAAPSSARIERGRERCVICQDNRLSSSRIR
jgi:hypothetical protein